MDLLLALLSLGAAITVLSNTNNTKMSGQKGDAFTHHLEDIPFIMYHINLLP